MSPASPVDVSESALRESVSAVLLGRVPVGHGAYTRVSPEDAPFYAADLARWVEGVLDMVGADPTQYPGRTIQQWVRHPAAPKAAPQQSSKDTTAPTAGAFRVEWSAADEVFEASSLEFPQVTWLADTAEEALAGVCRLVADVKSRDSNSEKFCCSAGGSSVAPDQER